MIPNKNNPNPPLESYVLDILSDRPRLTVKELYELFLQKSLRKISIQAFYALIHKMIGQRILVKENQVLIIDASWIDALLQFSEKVKATYLDSDAPVINIVLHPGEKRSFTFENVMAMDNFWMHALIVTSYFYRSNPHPTDHNACVYNYHSWFEIAKTGQEQSLAESYEQTGMNYYLLSGSHLYLDKAVKDIIDTKGFKYKTIEPAGSLGVNNYVTVVGDIIFETRLPKYVHELMEEVYAKVKNISEFERQEIVKIIQLPAKTILTIAHDKKRAKQFREAIKKYF